MKKHEKILLMAIPIFIFLAIFTARDVEVVEKCDIKFNEKGAKYEIGDKIPMGNLIYEIENLYYTKILNNENLEKSDSGVSGLVNSVRANQLYDFIGKDNYFLIVKLKVTNINSENGYRNFPNMFNLVKSDQRMYPVYTKAITCFKEYNGFFNLEVPPGKSQRGYVAFLVQDLEADYALKISGGSISILKELVYFKDEEIAEYKQ